MLGEGRPLTFGGRNAGHIRCDTPVSSETDFLRPTPDLPLKTSAYHAFVFNKYFSAHGCCQHTRSTPTTVSLSVLTHRGPVIRDLTANHLWTSTRSVVIKHAARVPSKYFAVSFICILGFLHGSVWWFAPRWDQQQERYSFPNCA